MSTTRGGSAAFADGDAGRREGLVLGVTAAAVVLAVLLPLPGGPDPSGLSPLDRRLIGLSTDDAFYYLEIAGRLAAGEGSSFDGIHRTNGYHPLWLGLLALAALVVDSPVGLLRAAFVLQVSFFALSVLLCHRCARRFLRPPSAVLAVLVWLALETIHVLPFSGMEHGLQLVLFLAVADAWFEARGRPSSTRDLRVGVLLALLVASRLETLLLVGILATSVAGRSPFSLRGVGRIGLPPVIVAFGWAGFSKIHFGTAVPVSALVKGAWSADRAASDPVGLDHGIVAAKLELLLRTIRDGSTVFALAVVFGTLGLALGIAASRRSGRRGSRGGLRVLDSGPLLAPFVFYSVVQIAALLVLRHGNLWFQPWYFVAQPWLAGLGVGWWIETIPIRPPRRRLIAALLAVAFTAHLARTLVIRGLHRVDGPEDHPLWAAAEAAREISPTVRVGSWNAGLVAFRLDGPVVNLDGLVNSLAYHEHGRLDLCGYLDDERIEVLVDAFPREGTPSYVGSSLEGCSHRFRTTWSEKAPRAWEGRILRFF